MFVSEGRTAERARDVLIEQILYLTCEWRASLFPSKGEGELAAYRLILRLGRETIGDVCCRICSHQISHLKAREWASSQPGWLPMYVQGPLRFITPEEVAITNFRTGMRPLLQVFSDMRFLQLPPQSHASATASAVTKQHERNFPPPACQHICWLAEVVSCNDVTEQDENGWNLFHHLFHSVTPSKLAGNIVGNMARPDYPMLQGDVRKAMQQTTTSLCPFHATPAHLLCQDSDGEFKKRDLIAALLASGIFVIADFDVPNDKVFVFFGGGKASSQVRLEPASSHM